jgi:hypothetical protein
MAREVFGDVIEAVDGATEDEVDAAAIRLDDRDHLDHAGGPSSTISLTPDGLERYEDLSGETVVGGDAERELLQFLSDYDREHSSSGVDRDRLIDELDLPAEDVDTLVWYLDASGLVGTVSGMGQEFFNVAITDRGRQRQE